MEGEIAIGAAIVGVLAGTLSWLPVINRLKRELKFTQDLAKARDDSNKTLSERLHKSIERESTLFREKARLQGELEKAQADLRDSRDDRMALWEESQTLRARLAQATKNDARDAKGRFTKASA